MSSGPRMAFERPRFVCPNRMQEHLEFVFQGEYDVPVFGHGLAVLDLGANFGAFSVWASHRWPYSKVYAYEPHPVTYQGLLANIAPYPNVEPRNWGVGTPGVRILRDGPNNEGEASLFWASGPEHQILTSDPLELPEAHILKCDTEGAELEILEPLIREGRTFTAILVEFHAAQTRRELDLLLKDYVLLDCKLHGPDLGILKYVNKGQF